MEQPDNSPWQYKPDSGETSSAYINRDTPNDQPAADGSPQSVSWQAAEFVEHHHSSGWYGALIASTALLVGLVYLTTKDFFATGTIIMVGIIIWVFASHKPNQVNYEITQKGLSVNGKTYAYSSFKSFSVFQEGPLTSVNLFPLKRFMPPVSAYFDPKDEAEVTDVLGNYLPYEERKLDGIDRLSHRLRF